ncbi:hypothetical protein HN803_07625 [candidate division WWE3 bacterium]|jgi:hypothetical protein|nr:hypothetical protein [candidate division WWE3 bacterium]
MKTIEKMNALDLQLILDYCKAYPFDVTFQTENDQVLLHDGNKVFNVIKCDNGLLVGTELCKGRHKKSIQINSAVIISNAVDAMIQGETCLPVVAIAKNGVPMSLLTYDDYVNDEELIKNGSS